LTFVSPPTVTTTSGFAPPDAGPPANLGQLPFGESGDIPDTVAWVPTPKNVTIPVSGYDGFTVDSINPARMFAICDFTGPGPVAIHALDPNNNEITPANKATVGSRVSFMTGTLAPQHLSFVIQNLGSAPVTVNCGVGFVPPPP